MVLAIDSLPPRPLPPTPWVGTRSKVKPGSDTWGAPKAIRSPVYFSTSVTRRSPGFCRSTGFKIAVAAKQVSSHNTHPQNPLQ